jgi:hypothetical protein
MSSQDDLVRTAALAAVRSYIEKRDDDRTANDAVRKAVPAWSQDRVDGFLRRRKDRLRSVANSARGTVESIVRDEKPYNGGV